MRETAKISYRKTGEGEYAATRDGVTVTVRRSWRRSVGHIWEVPEVLNGSNPTYSVSRHGAAEMAFGRLKRKAAE